MHYILMRAFQELYFVPKIASIHYRNKLEQMFSYETSGAWNNAWEISRRILIRSYFVLVEISIFYENNML